MAKKKYLTVEDIADACFKEMNKGNKDKVVLVCDDEEGNGYHLLPYLFSDCAQDVVNDGLVYLPADLKAKDCIVFG